MLNPSKKFDLLTYSIIVIVTILTAAILFHLINRHSVNVFFMDQWDFTISLFNNASAWEMFNYQHGPHRQGIGAFASYLIGSLTGWNMRAEAFFIGGILVLAAIAALYLKYRLFGKLTIWDSLISVICLSFTQCEIAFPNTNPGYTSIPLLLIILSGICLTLEKPALRYSLFAAVNFFAVFTGFSFFLGLIVPFILFYAAIIHWQAKERREMSFAAGAFVFSLLTLILFFNGYKFLPAVDCFQFPDPNPYNYLVFISNLLTLCVGFVGGYKALFAVPFGIFLFLIWLAVIFYHFFQTIKSKSFSLKNIVPFLFLGFSIVYALNTALGRVCLGAETAQSPRYMTLLIPGWLAIYFSVLLLKSDIWKTAILSIFIVLFVVLPIRRYDYFNQLFTGMTEQRQKWAACYLEKENIEECDKQTGSKVYPNASATHLQEKLNLLKQKRYNLFLSDK
jgi:hypothetical protein